jgi:hypothetical protein
VSPAHELAQVIERFGKDFETLHSPNAYVRRTLNALLRCRTSLLGGHIDKCEHCGHLRISYNSCRNRHCPKCQNTQREAWIESRKQDLIPAPYFHVVFTIPDKLNDLFLIILSYYIICYSVPPGRPYLSSVISNCKPKRAWLLFYIPGGKT